MEVLPCSGVQYVADSDCAQPSSEATFTYDGESNCLEHRKQVQVADGRMDDLLLSVEGNLAGRQDEGQGTRDELPISEEHHSGSSYYDCQAEGQRLSCGSHDYEDDDSNAHNCCTGPYLASENSHLIVDPIESESPSNNKERELPLSDPKWLERDQSVALWVKVAFLVLILISMKHHISYPKIMVLICITATVSRMCSHDMPSVYFLELVYLCA